MRIEVRRFGRLDFDAAWTLQKELAEKVTPEHGYLLLLEHAPVFTLGKNADARNVLDPHGIPVRRIDRGGDVTYHGPGQLVGYPILDIRRWGVKRFVSALEASLVALLDGYGVQARSRRDCVGVWTGRGKIASIGLRVSRGVTTHGFALNVCNDLAPFGYIHPCGEPGCAVTSLERELGASADVDEAADRFRLRLGRHMLKS